MVGCSTDPAGNLSACGVSSRCHQSNRTCPPFLFQDHWETNNTNEQARATFAQFQNSRQLPSHIREEIKLLERSSTSSKYIVFFHTCRKSLDSLICRTMIRFATPHLQEGVPNQPDDGHAEQTAGTNAAWQSSAEHQCMADARNLGRNGTMSSSLWQHVHVPPIVSSVHPGQGIQGDADCLPLQSQLAQKRPRVDSTVRDDTATRRQDAGDTYTHHLDGFPPLPEEGLHNFFFDDPPFLPSDSFPSSDGCLPLDGHNPEYRPM